MGNVALSIVVVVWISSMLFGRLIETKKLTILKGFSNFFFLLYHLWYVYAFFTYAQVKHWLGFSLIMINILIFFKGSFIFIKIYISRAIYLNWHLPINKVSGVQRRKCLNGRSQGKNVQVAGLAAYCNYFYKKLRGGGGI